MKTSLNQLLRGISTSLVQTVRQAWRELLNERMAATPIVLEKLRSDAWYSRPQGPGAKYLGILLALLHEQDAAAFKTEIQRLRSESIHPLYTLTVEMMTKRQDDRVYGEICGSIPVYIFREIDLPDVVFGHVQAWSQTRDLAISKVTRVDVIALNPDTDFRGAHNFFLDGIVLAWPNEVSSGVAKWWRNSNAERTFYHEVGHHFHQHSEGGQVKMQEREADAYQRVMYRNAHPIFVTTVWIVLFPLFPAMKFPRSFSKWRNGPDT